MRVLKVFYFQNLKKKKILYWMNWSFFIFLDNNKKIKINKSQFEIYSNSSVEVYFKI